MPTEAALLPTMAVTCSSAKEPRRTRHRPSLDHSVDTDMLVPGLQYLVHHHCLKWREGVNVVYNGLQRFFNTSSFKGQYYNGNSRGCQNNDNKKCLMIIRQIMVRYVYLPSRRGASSGRCCAESWWRFLSLAPGSKSQFATFGSSAGPLREMPVERAKVWKDKTS